MKRELVNEVIASVCDDSIRILDGTGKVGMSKSISEIIVGDTLYYCSYVGRLNKSDFPEMKSGVIKDKDLIEKIKSFIK